MELSLACATTDTAIRNGLSPPAWMNSAMSASSRRYDGVSPRAASFIEIHARRQRYANIKREAAEFGAVGGETRDIDQRVESPVRAHDRREAQTRQFRQQAGAIGAVERAARLAFVICRKRRECGGLRRRGRADE